MNQVSPNWAIPGISGGNTIINCQFHTDGCSGCFRCWTVINNAEISDHFCSQVTAQIPNDRIFLVEVPRQRNSGWKDINDVLLHFSLQRGRQSPHSSPLFAHLYLFVFVTWPTATRYVSEHSLPADQGVVGGRLLVKKTWLHRRKICSIPPTSWAQAAISPAWRSLPPFAGLNLSSPWGGCCSAVTSSVRCPSRQVASLSLGLLPGFIFFPNTYSLWLPR